MIKKGGLHRPSGNGYTIALPAAGADPLNLKPALDEIQRLLEASLGARVAVTDILARLARQPYGVRAGLAPLLLAIAVQARAHELAVYESGTFRSSFGAQEFLRLIKAPATFELQHCRLEGVRAEVFARLAETFAQSTKAREPQILDVVQPLCRFAAQLPEYTRKAGALESSVAKVRDVLLSATEPFGMLFNDLPMACGLEPFSTAETADPDRAKLFVARLQSAVNDLRSAYPRLLGRQPNVDAGEIRHNAMKLAMTVGDSRHYVINSIMPRHFLQTAANAAYPRLSSKASRRNRKRYGSRD